MGRASYQKEFRIGQKGREVGERTNAQEDKRRIPAVANAGIEEVEYRVIFVQSDFKTYGLEGNVAEDDAESDGNQQQRLKVLLNG